MLPTEEEVKEAVFASSGESDCGPDGFTGLFFQSCWEIVKLDVVDMVKAFFVGQELPRFITHTNLILIPKKEQVQSFSDLRPISLRLISENQSAFVKGRSIMENVLLTQEIVKDIKKITKIANVVVKLDMTKEYDRVSWLFLSKVLINLVLVRCSLTWCSDYCQTIAADQHSVKLMMRVLTRYEKVSGQLVNMNKSAFYVHEKVQSGLVSRLKQITRIRQGFFPFTYLGCPIFYSRNKISYYDPFVKKIAKRVHAWKGKLLSWRKGNIDISCVTKYGSIPIIKSEPSKGCDQTNA
ncbi:uncharacterized protein LOC132041478 [Lycium ferocissimum]|uniref:uncharacterized protein LOC132041478 n=1 Tax=Lycium ferocissimum TaxID=112874 RepID=UPI002815B30A|nr:uncharacterized protein LOC132041478 [Lycium ferocissimum]